MRLAALALLVAAVAEAQQNCVIVTGVVNGLTREFVSCPSSVTGAGTTCSAGQYVSAVSSAGALTCSTPSGGSDPWLRVATTSDTVNSTVTPAAVTGLTLALSASTNYIVRCLLVTSAAAATTGVQLTPTGPAAMTAVTWTRQSCASSTTTRAFQGNSLAIDAATASAGTTRCVETVAFVIRNGANAGTLGFNLQSEVAASATTVHTGSWCERISF